MQNRRHYAKKVYLRTGSNYAGRRKDLADVPSSSKIQASCYHQYTIYVLHLLMGYKVTSHDLSLLLPKAGSPEARTE